MSNVLISPDKFLGDMLVDGNLSIKVISQNDEPTIDADNKFVVWKDTNDNDRIYLIFRRASGDQVKVELSA